MKSTLEKVQEIKKHGYHLDIGEVISQTFENYKKIALLSGGVIIVLVMLFFVVAMGIGGVLGLAMSFTDFITDYSVGNLSAAVLLIRLGVTVVIGAVLSPITAGIMQIAHNAETNRDFDFSTVFVHYKTKYFKQLFLATFIIALTTSSIETIIQVSQLYFYDAVLTTILNIFAFLLSMIVTILTLLTVPFIIFGNLSAIDAIKSSITTVSKRFWIILLVMIICFLCAMMGIFALCIGIFFTISIYISAQYIIYRNAIPLEEKDELDEIGTSEY